MPRGDGTGPKGDGSGAGRGRGRGQGPRSGLGEGGNCVCINCGEKVSHQVSVPCMETTCPKCGAAMKRESIESRP